MGTNLTGTVLSLATQVPWRDLPVQAVQSILNYPDMKMRDGKDVSNTLISYITGFQNQLAQHGMDTTIHVAAAFTDRFKADGKTLTYAFTLLDRFLSQLLLGKLTTEVRMV